MGVWGSTGRVEDGRIAPITEGPFEHRAADDQVLIRRDGRVQVLGGRFDSLYTYDPEADAFDRGPVGIGDRNAYIMHDPFSDSVFAYTDGVYHEVEHSPRGVLRRTA